MITEFDLFILLLPAEYNAVQSVKEHSVHRHSVQLVITLAPLSPLVGQHLSHIPEAKLFNDGDPVQRVNLGHLESFGSNGEPKVEVGAVGFVRVGVLFKLLLLGVKAASADTDLEWRRVMRMS